MSRCVLVVVVVAAGAGCGGAVATQPVTPPLTPAERSALASLSPPSLPPPPADASNRWADDDGAAALGQRLFFEPGFSGELLDGDNDGSAHALGLQGDVGKVACAGCHLPQSGFADTRSLNAQISLAAGWGIRRAPSLLDVGQSKLIMWDGRRDALYNQVFGPIESAVEMNSGRLYAVEQLFARHRADYEALFGAMPPLDDTTRFPALAAHDAGCRRLDTNNQCTTPLRGGPGDGAEYDHLAPADQAAVTRVWVNVGKAIGAYERRLACGAGRFDRWMHGDASALSAGEQRGAALFVGKAQCVRCHSGPFLSDEKFHNVGLLPTLVATVFVDANDPGAARGLAALAGDPLNVRGAFSDGDDGRDPGDVTPAMSGAFRTPRLRCVGQRPSFMHTGQLRTLDDVVSFFDRGGDGYGFPGQNELAPLGLSDGERHDLVAFLATLDGPGPDPSLLAPPQ
jgi:cytochrome c peroxidase